MAFKKPEKNDPDQVEGRNGPPSSSCSSRSLSTISSNSESLVDLRSTRNSLPLIFSVDGYTPATKTEIALAKLVDLKDDCNFHRAISESKKHEIETIIENGRLLHSENGSKIRQSEDTVISTLKSYFEKLQQENDEKFSQFKAPHVEAIKKIDGLITGMGNTFNKYCTLTDKLNRLVPDGKDDVVDKVLNYNSFKIPKLPDVKISQFDFEHIPHDPDLENFLKRNISTFGHLSKRKKN